MAVSLGDAARATWCLVWRCQIWRRFARSKAGGYHAVVYDGPNPAKMCGNPAVGRFGSCLHHTYAKPRVIERSHAAFAELRDAPRPLYRLGSVLDIIQRLPELPGTQVSVCCLLLVAAAAIFTLWSPTLYLSSSFCCAVDGLLVLPRAPL